MPGVQGWKSARRWAALVAGFGVSITAGVTAATMAVGQIDPVYRSSYEPRDWTVARGPHRDEWAGTTPVIALTSVPWTGSGFVDAGAARVDSDVGSDAWDRQMTAEARRWQAHWDREAKADQARIDADSRAGTRAELTPAVDREPDEPPVASQPEPAVVEPVEAVPATELVTG